MKEKKAGPEIEATTDGPYLVHDIEKLKDSYGRTVAEGREMWLCRCGRSGDKPFCDSSHLSADFSGENESRENESDQVERGFRDYHGRSLTVHDNRRVCAHVRYCTSGAPGTFQKGRRPWILPDEDPPEVVKETIRRCPSGALAYSEGGVRHEETGRPASIRVSQDGPYEVAGGPELSGQLSEPPTCKEHYTLCRCGLSKNKPYCDGTHVEAGFKDEKN